MTGFSRKPKEHYQCPEHRYPRRTFWLAALALWAALGWLSHKHGHPTAAADGSSYLRTSGTTSTALAMRSLSGRVIEVHHPGAVKTGQKTKGYTERNRPAVKAMIDRGMKELTGSEDAVQAWRHFFSPGDRVGIKVVPVGKPDSISSYEVVLEVIDGLKSAGVRSGDILLFERYKKELMGSGYHEILPEGVHWEASSVQYDDPQLEIDGQMPGQPREDHIAGYDPDVFRHIDYCHPQHDSKDDRRFRSHLSTIVTRKIDKFICIPVLKDHRSSGVTLAAQEPIAWPGE